MPVGTDECTQVRNVQYADGALVFFVRAPSFDQDTLVATRVDTNGDFVWSPSLIDVCSVASGKSRLAAVLSVLDMAILAWTDSRDDGGDIYAQNVNEDGTLGSSECTPHPFGDVTDSGADCPPAPPNINTSGCSELIGLPDIVYVLNAFAEGGNWAVCYPNADLMSALADPCDPDDSVALPDIVAVLNAFAGQYDCPSDCPCP